LIAHHHQPDAQLFVRHAVDKEGSSWGAYGKARQAWLIAWMLLSVEPDRLPTRTPLATATPNQSVGD
jgi:hypothetical protein